jgi:hypothetical protein
MKIGKSTQAHRDYVDEKRVRKRALYTHSPINHGGLAQLARAPALQAGGHRFESDILHSKGDSNDAIQERGDKRFSWIF